MRPVNLNNLVKNGKCLILAYDQGFEHGPVDFNEKNVNPDYVFDIALEGRYNALAVQAGIAEKHHNRHYKDVHILIKLNGKSKYDSRDPLALQHTSVKYAASLGAVAVGYTIYLGSIHEQKMFAEFGRICEEAHMLGLPVVCWMYPRGSNISNDLDTETLAYGVRIASELGADIIKIKFNNDIEGLKWIVKAAGRAKIVIAGGNKQSEGDFLTMVKTIMDAGAIGLAVGRNVWQHQNPLELTNNIKKIIFSD